jgi:lipase
MTLHVHVFGPEDGRPLLVVHGIRGHGRRWRHLAETELTGFRVYAPDLRGHGHSPPEPPWTLEQHAADALAVLDARGLDTVDVMGHSLGATVAIYLGRLAPDRVRRLVLLDPGIGIRPDVAGLLADRETASAGFADPAEAAAARAAYWPEAAHHLIAEEVADHLERGADGRWRWRYRPAMAATTYSELARPAVAPTRPTLLVVATDGVVRPEFVGICRADLGDDLTLVDIECAHHVHLERPAEIGNLVRSYLA